MRAASTAGALGLDLTQIVMFRPAGDKPRSASLAGGGGDTIRVDPPADLSYDPRLPAVCTTGYPPSESAAQAY